MLIDGFWRYFQRHHIIDSRVGADMKKTGALLGLCMTVVGSTVSLAGSKGSQYVTIDTAAGLAYGSMGSVRNSSDFTQHLYCTFYASGYAYCYARDSVGVSASCMTTNVNMIETIRSLNSDSFLRFNYDSSGNCTEILVGTGSTYDPKAP